MQKNKFKFLILSLLFTLNVLGAGTYIKGPALIEGFTTITSAAGTTTLTVASETKQIVTGATTQTIELPDADSLPLGRKFLIINKSSGDVTVNDGSGALLVTVDGGTQAEVHLRAGGSLAGTWDVLESSAGGGGGGGGTWGSITGFLTDQTDLQSALDAKADENNPGFSGTIGTTITASRLLVTDGSSNLAASGTTATEAGYLSGVTGGIQTQLDAKQARSTLTTKGDLYVATASATTARQGVGSDGQILAADSTKTNGIKWIDPVNADNLIFDGDAEAGITNFVEGSYSAATRPSGTFTPSSGAGTFEISTSSSSPLFGANSFLLTKSSGASRQGRAIERTINLDSGYQTKMLKTRIDYTIVSGSFVAGSNGSSPTDSSLIWYVGQYNGSTWTYHEPSTFKMFSNSTTNKDWVEGEFQVNADTTQLKLIGFISESANSAWVVKAEVGFRLSAYLAGTPISDWVAYTPTYNGLGTLSLNTAFWRRVGDEIEVKALATAGTTAASLAYLTLPTGKTIDSTKIGTNALIGKLSASLTPFSGGLVAFPGTSTTNIYFSSDLANYNTGVNGNTWANSTSFGIFFSVPISGWSSSVQVSDGYDGREISFSAEGVTSNAVGANTVVSYNTVTVDKTNSYNTTTDVWTVPTSGTYEIYAQHRINTAGTATVNQYAGLLIQVDSVTKREFYNYVQNTGISTWYVNGSYLVDLTAGQGVRILADTNITSPQLGTNATQNYIQIKKLQAPTTISATEVVSALYTGTPTGTLANSWNNITFGTKSVDTHNAYSGGVYTVPVSGNYDISAQTSQNASYVLGNEAVVAIAIDGSTTFNAVNAAWGTLTENLYPSINVKSVPLRAGQTVAIQCLNNGTTPTFTAIITNPNWFSISRVK